MNLRLAAVAASFLIVLAGCGGNTDNKPASDSSSSVPKRPTKAIELAVGLNAKISSITKTVQITEDNDPNDKIGRPGGYTDAAVLYDGTVDLCTKDDFGAVCGASIEIWPSAAEVDERSKFILKTLKSADGILGSEYDYLNGNQLLRVDGGIKPSLAKKYEAAWKALG